MSVVISWLLKTRMSSLQCPDHRNLHTGRRYLSEPADDSCYIEGISCSQAPSLFAVEAAVGTLENSGSIQYIRFRWIGLPTSVQYEILSCPGVLLHQRLLRAGGYPNLFQIVLLIDGVYHYIMLCIDSIGFEL